MCVCSKILKRWYLERGKYKQAETECGGGGGGGGEVF